MSVPFGEMPVPAKHIYDFLCSLKGGRTTCQTTDFEVSGLAHVEDGGSRTMCWYRREPLEPVRDTLGIVITNQKKVPKANIYVFHSDPRGMIRELIERFFPPTEIRLIRGDGCRIHATATLCGDGQGYSWTGNEWATFPHCGGLRIGDDVHIGALTSVMRGSVGDTVIGSDTKIGNGVNIGHDTRIGKHVLIIAGASLAGWVRVGDHSKIWQGALIKNGVHIGRNAEVAMGAVVLEDVPEGEVWAGNPAKKIR